MSAVVVCLREQDSTAAAKLAVKLPVHQCVHNQALFSGTAGAVGVPGTGFVGSEKEKEKQKSPRPKQRGL